MSPKDQGKILSNLPPGSAVALEEGDSTCPRIISMDTESLQTFSPLQGLAESTGGLVGVVKEPEQLPVIMEVISAHVLEDIQEYPALDIALVLDTTASMSDDIDQIKRHLRAFLENLQQHMDDSAAPIRVAIVEYRDDDHDSFLHRIDVDFTSNFLQATQQIQRLSTKGGGDLPEATYDVRHRNNWNISIKSGCPFYRVHKYLI